MQVTTNQLTRPLRLLDAFCGAGGCSVGYHRAGFTEIVGVDIAPQPRFPFTFVQADALEFLAGVQPGEFDLIHCSPPCQGYSRMRHLPWLKGKEWPKLIEPTRELLCRIGTPWVIENVADAPLDGLILCGGMFPELKVYRHRRFESSHVILAPAHPRHRQVLGPQQEGRRSYLNDRRNPNADGWVSVIRGMGGTARRPPCRVRAGRGAGGRGAPHRPPRLPAPLLRPARSSRVPRGRGGRALRLRERPLLCVIPMPDLFTLAALFLALAAFCAWWMSEERRLRTPSNDPTPGDVAGRRDL